MSGPRRRFGTTVARLPGIISVMELGRERGSPFMAVDVRGWRRSTVREADQVQADRPASERSEEAKARSGEIVRVDTGKRKPAGELALNSEPARTAQWRRRCV